MKKSILIFQRVFTVFIAIVGVVFFRHQQAKAAGNTYYVSSSQGNDANNGLSTDTAWKTLAKANAKTFSPGDKLLLKRMDTWVSECLVLHGSGTAASPIQVGAYGTGTKPIIAGDVTDTSFTWSAVPGHAGVYSSPGPPTMPYILYEGTTAHESEDPGALTLNNPTDLNTFLNTFHPGDWGKSTTTLYIDRKSTRLNSSHP
jgi:hypothetical protein